MDKRAKLPQLPSRQPAPTSPQLPSLDRGAAPVQPIQPVQLGPQKLDSLDAKLALQKSLASDVIPVKFTQQFPCGVHGCLNYTNQGQISFDLTFQMYRISIICPYCMKNPRP
jgi:hypothetical protein